MHIWYQWLESVKTSAINVLPNRQYMDHSLYLPKQFLTPCQSQQQKMRHILSHSWWNYNWRTKSATDDLHHHRSIQVKKDDHTFSSKNCMETKVHSAKKNSGYHFIYLDNHNIQRQMNKQSGFNAEQIEKDNDPESKTIWRLNLKWRVYTAKQTIWLKKSTSNNKRR